MKMEGPQKLVRKLKKGVAVAAISALGVLPHGAKGQDFDNLQGETPIEHAEEFSQQIFSTIETAFKNGSLESNPDYPNLFKKEQEAYKIWYELFPSHNDDEKPKYAVEVRYKEGNSNYILSKNTKNGKEVDLVFNYKDESLLDAKEGTYRDLATEYHIIIMELYGKNDHPARYRQINEKEKAQILSDVRSILGNT